MIHNASLVPDYIHVDQNDGQVVLIYNVNLFL